MNSWAGKYKAIKQGAVRGVQSGLVYQYQPWAYLFIDKNDVFSHVGTNAGLGRKHCTATRVAIPYCQLRSDFEIIT
jgi:hypothetical protein